MEDGELDIYNAERERAERGIHKIKHIPYNYSDRYVQEVKNKVNEIIEVLNALIDE